MRRSESSARSLAPRGAHESLNTTPQLTEAKEAVRKGSGSGCRSATGEPPVRTGRVTFETPFRQEKSAPEVSPARFGHQTDL